MIQTIEEISEAITQLKADALARLEVPGDVAASIGLAAPPTPEMGDLGFPCFALARHLRKGPPIIAQEVKAIIEELAGDEPLFAEWKAEGPYVNVAFEPARLNAIVIEQALAGSFGANSVAESKHWMVEYSAPNTNKPQHLGHVRNNLLGSVCSSLLDFVGHDVTRVNLINDRGIHICKSMLAYQKFGDGETPESSGIKGDHLVGKYYVEFNKQFKAEYGQWLETDAAQARFDAWKANLADDADNSRDVFAKNYEDAYFNAESELGAETKAMLRAWEAGDEEVLALWNLMNSWVFDGFAQTYERMGVEFDRVYKESETYLLGKDIVVEGLEKGIFEKIDGGAVVCDLEKIGMTGQKVLLRSDGTTVYMTQDLGTALARFDEYDIDKMVYCVGNEQDYHFKVLFGILGLVREELDGQFFHLSYGMVELPEGKMKSREGTVVDADDLMAETIGLAREAVDERYTDIDEADAAHRAEVIGLAGLKYFVLDFNPKTTVHFDPKKSVEFQGRTGPYCLYSYARVQSLMAEVGGMPELDDAGRAAALAALSTPIELDVVRELQAWPAAVLGAAEFFEPSRVTEQLFKIAKSFSTLYNDRDHRVKEIDGPRRDGLLLLSEAVARTLATGLELLGIHTLESM